MVNKMCSIYRGKKKEVKEKKRKKEARRVPKPTLGPSSPSILGPSSLSSTRPVG